MDENVAKKRGEAFKRCMKQMKSTFKDCLTKLAGNKNADEKFGPEHTNQTGPIQQLLDENENETASYEVLESTNQTSAEQRYEIMRQLQSSLMEKLSKVPPGKLKIGLLDRFKKELSKIMKAYPPSGNVTDDDPMAKLQSSLLEKLAKEIHLQEEQERMHDPKYRRKMTEMQDREKLEVEMNEMQETLKLDLERRSKLQFPENVPSRIRGKLMRRNPKMASSLCPKLF